MFKISIVISIHSAIVQHIAPKIPSRNASHFLYFMIGLSMIMVFPGCSYYYAKSAAPIEKIVPYIENHPLVRAELGEDSSVSLAVAKEFERDIFRSWRGEDRVELLTWVKGSKKEAWLRVDARNVDKQGWAGVFSVEIAGKSVLRENKYVLEGRKIILRGTILADGSPIESK